MSPRPVTQELKWRWQLVDSLSHGRRYWPVKLKLSELDSDGALLIEMEEAKRTHNLARMKESVQKGKERISKCLLTFSAEESRRTLCTPRFDITNAVFLKSDVPYEQWNEYVRSLPPLAAPFPEFWMVWAWYGDNRICDTSFASRLKHTIRDDRSSVLAIDTFIDIPPKHVADGEQIIVKIDGELELDSEMKATEIRTEENDIILFIPLLHSLALLGCRNVKTTEVIAPRQIRRQVMRTHGVAICSYHILTIGNNRVSNYAKSDRGGHRGISICRGHFKTYDEHGLFGNRKGTWWWQSSARGGYEDGVRVRDYVLDRKEIPMETSEVKP